jgi:hypothetical protein
MKKNVSLNFVGAVVASFVAGVPMASYAGSGLFGADGLAISLGLAMNDGPTSVALSAGLGSHVTAAAVSDGLSAGALASSSSDGSNRASVHVDEDGMYQTTVSFRDAGILETLGDLENLQKCTTTDGLTLLQIGSANPNSALGDLSGAFLGYDAATETACYFDGEP